MNKFPEDFIWGTATSSYQIEGAADIDGKGPSIWDSFCTIPRKIAQGKTGNIACDHYHKFKEDIQLMKEMGVKAYRFSIAWARVLPTGKGAVNEKGIEFYSELIDELLKADIEPWVTLYHWDLPLTLQLEEDGWLNKNMANYFADWNDTVNLPGDAESIFNANLYGKALLEMIALLEYLGDNELADQYKKDHAHMKEIVNTHCWDGDWYLRYFEDNGNPIGSKQNSEGQIYTNAQSWTILSGFATEERALKSLDSVEEKLNTKFGIKLSYPGYNGYDESIGGVSTYPPGAKENGGIFLHSNPRVMIAETLMGNGDRAFQYYNQINPASKNDIIDTFECDPYCYPQNILGDEHPQFGLARNSWLSGTSSWTYQAATKYIMGVRPDHNGLIIDPCIPKSWNGFTGVRKFRNATYNITVKNPNNVSKRYKSMLVDGKEIEGNIAPIFNDGKEHTVDIILG